MNAQSATTTPTTRKYIHSFALNSSPVFGAPLPVLEPPAALPDEVPPVVVVLAPATLELLEELDDELFELDEELSVYAIA